MQFDVVHRLGHEYGIWVELTSALYKLARRTDATHLARQTWVRVTSRHDGTLLALFESPYRLERLQSEHANWTLDTMVIR